ncbi:DUF3099 domain-containing protein [Arthrobacter psychrolactophilus]|uniref:DUF3099 domain-containing protein n=1 Tax=Arthrobacter psychrolactophilus TaxID=92442 RepID=A0A2V5IPF3_9MICC|nr:DUF3099 domain-containing protein [Arthrobacter psychrolactophilus]PYI38435.1 DUF3099 domain-containing protein [Arthrobacter psychrolactophilus]
MKEQPATPKFGAPRRSKFRQGAAESEIPAITNATQAHSDEMRGRMIKYAVTMGIRMVCLGAIFLFHGWYVLIPIVGAVILPWVAVMIANGGADIVHRKTVELLDAAPLYEVESGQQEKHDDEDQLGEILTGEIVPDEEEPSEAGPAETASENSSEKQDRHEHL